MRVRRAIGLALIVQEDALCIYDASSRRIWSGTALIDGALTDLLLFCHDWQPLDEAVARLKTIQPPVHDARACILTLLEEGLLESDRGAPPGQVPVEISRTWAEYGWGDAWLYHKHVTNLPMLNYSSGGYTYDESMMRQYVAESPPPPVYKDMPGPSIELSRVDQMDERLGIYDSVSCVPMDRSSSQITLDEFSWLIAMAFGQVGTCLMPVTGRPRAQDLPLGRKPAPD